jgi:DNA-binding SARP family transcriptional activator/pimeloyl-ACP methyl ester carboxylesterase
MFTTGTRARWLVRLDVCSRLYNPIDNAHEIGLPMRDMQLEIRLLGELAVLRQGEELKLPQSRKTRALLAYLVLKGGRVRRDHLCDLLWQVPDDPRGSLRWALSKLRALVDTDDTRHIEADREHVAFTLTHVKTDIHELRQRLAQDISTLGSDELEELAGYLSRGLLQGLELPGQPEFDNFVTAEREQLRQARSQVLRLIVERHDNDPAMCAQYLQQLVQVEPYEFSYHRKLIASLARAGRAGDAQRQCRASCAQFRDIPGADLAALERAARSRPTRASGNTELPPLKQEVQFCKTADGVQIAYASVGAGMPIIKAANWLNHLEYDWESPVWRHVFRALAENRQLVRYDARGNGLSDWDVNDFSFAAMVSDLVAVVDATGIERFPLIGISQGCAVCVEYAARHPERVSKLLLVGGYARGWKLTDSEEFAAKIEAMIRLIELGWGDHRNTAFRQLFTSMFMPNAPRENQDWFNELQRKTATPGNAAKLMRALGDVDIRHRLGLVAAPTLVLHARHDMVVPYSAGLELAGGIPGARFVTLHSSNHLLPQSDPAWAQLQTEINSFLAR